MFFNGKCAIFRLYGSFLLFPYMALNNGRLLAGSLCLSFVLKAVWLSLG